MEPALELVAFATRSENRTDVLATLAEGPLTRADLQDATGVPRATVSRILADFRERDVVARDGHEYRTTPLGDEVASGLAALAASIESARSLQALAGWMPLDELGVPFDALSSAEVTLPTPTDPMAPVRRVATVAEGAGRVRTACYSVVHAPILASMRGVEEGDQRLEGVIAAGVLDVIAAEPELAEVARGLFASGRTDLYLAGGDVGPQLVLADRTTMFLVTDDEGAIKGLVESEADAVRRRARSLFESAKRDAEPIAAETAAELLTA